MGEGRISDAHLDALARYARDEISTGRLTELLGVSLMDLLDLRNAVQRDDAAEVARLTAEVERLRGAIRAWLAENDTEGFGCACMPERTCGTCQWRQRSERLRLLAALPPAAPLAPDTEGKDG
jgi:hypothetical protein